jgi:hypothetical protein
VFDNACRKVNPFQCALDNKPGPALHCVTQTFHSEFESLEALLRRCSRRSRVNIPRPLQFELCATSHSPVQFRVRGTLAVRNKLICVAANDVKNGVIFVVYTRCQAKFPTSDILSSEEFWTSRRMTLTRARSAREVHNEFGSIDASNKRICITLLSPSKQISNTRYVIARYIRARTLCSIENVSSKCRAGNFSFQMRRRMRARLGGAVKTTMVQARVPMKLNRKQLIEREAFALLYCRVVYL